MTLQARTRNPSQLHADRARLLLREVARRISGGGLDTQSDLLGALNKTLEEFYLGLKDPAFTGYRISRDDIRDPDLFARKLRQIESDLTSLYRDSGGIARVAAQSINWDEMVISGAETEMKQVTSLSQDLQMVTGIGDELVLAAGDDFADRTAVDPLFLSGQSAHVDVEQGVLTLNRISSEDISQFVTAIDVETLSAATIYEGDLYRLDLQALPEGGQLRLQRDQTRPLGIPDRPVVFDGSPPTVVDADHDSRVRAARLKMVDSDPTTAWIAQVVIPILNALGQRGLSGNPIPVPVTIEPGQPPPTQSIVQFGDGQYRIRDKDGTTITILQGNDQVGPDPSVIDVSSDFLSILGSPDAVRDILRGIDETQGREFDLKLRLTLTLDQPRDINWLSLNPLAHHRGAYLQVDNIELGRVDQTSGDVVYEQLDGINEGAFENVLTEEANEELTDTELAATLAPGRFNHAGEGIWTFPVASGLKTIRLTVTQRGLVPAPYSVIRFEEERVVTTKVTTTTKKRRLLSNKTSTAVSTTENNMSRIVELDYINSLRLAGSAQSTDGLGVTTQSTTGTDQQTGTVPLHELFRDGTSEGRDLIAGLGIGGDVGGFIGQGLGNLVGGLEVVTEFASRLLGLGTSRETTVDTNDSGWQIKDQYLTTKLDKAKYEVGIRDVGVFAYTYGPDSVMASRVFHAPGDIVKVTLDVDEVIPREFADVDPTVRWLEYAVSFDDSDWLQILPQRPGPAQMLDAQQLIPQVINVNSSLPAGARDPRQGYADVSTPRRVRFRVTMKRPPALDKQTPALKGYRLNLLVKQEPLDASRRR